MPRIEQVHQESRRRSDRIREIAQRKLASTEKQEPSSPSNKRTKSQTKPSANMQKKRKAPASQHVEKQPKKPCRQQNPAVPDAGNIDQEWIQAFLQTVKGSSIHYWIQNDRWPKTLFNNVLGFVLVHHEKARSLLKKNMRTTMKKRMRIAIKTVLKPISITYS
ncbi:hypothetical protein BDQ94DRAFT_165024 [Aspergillus welwitschiae]|uniref:Uncharacterized protein n=1 Tax=Aspergillus welwitschiae TaxID=1341132 RepID=A0A3F3QJW5_9EURO|nr:hypothetical protein BDQ94DRAFT_165024 [Aspergillus welwitschiae]RDH39290.1 hypothetical protein BDQ94DRAFT_165024 [Aspergillus welwitschiae]